MNIVKITCSLLLLLSFGSTSAHIVPYSDGDTDSGFVRIAQMVVSELSAEHKLPGYQVDSVSLEHILSVEKLRLNLTWSEICSPDAPCEKANIDTIQTSYELTITNESEGYCGGKAITAVSEASSMDDNRREIELLDLTFAPASCSSGPGKIKVEYKTQNPKTGSVGESTFYGDWIRWH